MEDIQLGFILLLLGLFAWFLLLEFNIEFRRKGLWLYLFPLIGIGYMIYGLGSILFSDPTPTYVSQRTRTPYQKTATAEAKIDATHTAQARTRLKPTHTPTHYSANYHPHTPRPKDKWIDVTLEGNDHPSYCVEWTEVTTLDEGKKMCVWGNVRNAYDTTDMSYIIFGSDDTDFRFLDHDYYLTNWRSGECVMGEGTVGVWKGVPYIDLNGKLYHCP